MDNDTSLLPFPVGWSLGRGGWQGDLEVEAQGHKGGTCQHQEAQLGSPVSSSTPVLGPMGAYWGWPHAPRPTGSPACPSMAPADLEALRHFEVHSLPDPAAAQVPCPLPHQVLGVVGHIGDAEAAGGRAVEVAIQHKLGTGRGVSEH